MYASHENIEAVVAACYCLNGFYVDQDVDIVVMAKDQGLI